MTVARPFSGDVNSPAAQRFFQAAPNAIVVTDLRVQFSVEKTLQKEPNRCEITITNLSERTRGELQKKPLLVRLDAGYDGQLARIFSGDLRWAQSKHEGPDWETMMQVGDGDRAFRFARVSRSFKPGTKARVLVEEAAKAMGLQMPADARAMTELLAEYASSVVVQGPAHVELSRVLDAVGLSWSVQDGRLQILQSTGVRRDQAILVRQDTGLIGTPDYSAPEKKGESPKLTFKMLLYPGLTPGGKVRLETSQINGNFKVLRVAHTGDTHGEPWTSEVEAKPL